MTLDAVCDSFIAGSTCLVSRALFLLLFSAVAFDYPLAGQARSSRLVADSPVSPLVRLLLLLAPSLISAVGTEHDGQAQR